MTDESCCLGLPNMTPVWLNASEWKEYLSPLSLPRSRSAAVVGYQSFVVQTIVAAIKEAR